MDSAEEADADPEVPSSLRFNFALRDSLSDNSGNPFDLLVSAFLCRSLLSVFLGTLLLRGFKVPLEESSCLWLLELG